MNTFTNANHRPPEVSCKAAVHSSLALLFAVVTWFAVIVQFVLMLQNRAAYVPETIVRFFCFSTILTNTMVAFFFTGQVLKIGRTYRPGILSAVTVYVFMVGIVYQVLLQHIWQPAGLKLVVDALLHTINPLLFILYWYLFEEKSVVRYSRIRGWLVCPLAYLVYIMIRKSFSGFYLYPLVNITGIGLTRVLLTSGLLTLFFIVIPFLFIASGRKAEGKKPAIIMLPQ